MSSDNKQKAEQLIKCSDERKMQFAQLTGKLPMSTGKRVLIYLLIAIIAGAAGFGACYIKGKTEQPSKDIVITLNKNDNTMISIAHSNIGAFSNIHVGDSCFSLSDDKNIMASLEYISDYTVKHKQKDDIQSLKVVFTTEGEKKDTMQIGAQNTLFKALKDRKARVTNFVIGDESPYSPPKGEGDSLDVSSADYYLWLVRTIAEKAGKEKKDNIAY